jgi:hypothetical protein
MRHGGPLPLFPFVGELIALDHGGLALSLADDARLFRTISEAIETAIANKTAGAGRRAISSRKTAARGKRTAGIRGAAPVRRARKKTPIGGAQNEVYTSKRKRSTRKRN